VPIEKLPETLVQQSLARLNEGNNAPWKITNNKLQKTFVFRNFIEAFGFMSMVALEAEKINHHPEWSNVYKTVMVELTTHEFNGITQLDFDLAQRMESLTSGTPG
jgi:4a-hydroxytetrahydrobiopterin dehydratase